MNSNRLARAVVALALTVGVGTLAGCGDDSESSDKSSSEKTVDESTETASEGTETDGTETDGAEGGTETEGTDGTEDGTETDGVDVDVDDDEVTIDSSQGTLTTGGERPEGLPAEVKLPEGEILLSTDTPTGSMVQVKPSGDPQAAFDEMVSELESAGWKSVTPGTTGADGSALLEGEKGASVVLTLDSVDKSVLVVYAAPL